MRYFKQKTYARQVASKVIQLFRDETNDRDVLAIVEAYASRLPIELSKRSIDVELTEIPIDTTVQWTIQSLGEDANAEALKALEECSEKEKKENPEEVERFIRAVRTIQELCVLLVEQPTAKAA